MDILFIACGVLFLAAAALCALRTGRIFGSLYRRR